MVTADDTEISYFSPNFSIKKNRKFVVVFFSLMNTKSDILTRDFATRENIAFGVHSVK